MTRFLLLLLIVSSSASAQDNQSPTLPIEAESTLQAVFPGYKYATTMEWAIRLHQAYNPDSWPWLAIGDFDGDGVQDYAVLLLLSDREKAYRATLIALMARGSSYEVMTVTGGADGQLLSVSPKGSAYVQYEWEGRESERPRWPFDNDALVLGYEGKPPGFWVWNEGKFVNLFELMD